MLNAKVMLLGDMGVGKTSLAQRLVFDRFETDYKTTIGVQIMTHDVPLGTSASSEMMRMVLWDTDGDFGQQIFNTVYVTGASAAMIVCDASRPATIDRMVQLTHDFATHFPGRPFKAIVNKIDLIDTDAHTIMPSGVHPDDVVTTSAKTGEGVISAFQALAQSIARRQGS